MSTLLRHNIGKISESSPFPVVVWELLLLSHTRGNLISHVMGEGGHHSATGRTATVVYMLTVLFTKYMYIEATEQVWRGR